MLVTGCGPQEIEKYCLLLPYCNIVLDKVLEIFFIIYHRETLSALARLQYCPARALRALGMLLADGAPTLGRGKTF